MPDIAFNMGTIAAVISILVLICIIYSAHTLGLIRINSEEQLKLLQQIRDRLPKQSVEK